MARKKKERIVYENIEIIDVAAEGKSIAKVDDKIVFVPFTIPGDVVDVQIGRSRKKFAEGRVVNFVKRSENRVEPVCEHFGVCGGCKWQMLPYQDQIKFKQQQVVDNLVRLGKVELPEISLILGSAKTEFYRNKLEFTFSNKMWLTQEQVNSGEEFDNMNAVGFHIPGMFDKVLDVHKCWLQDDISNQVRNFIRDYCHKKDYTFFDLRNRGGLMRTLVVRTSSIGQLMLIVVFYDDDKEQRDDLMAAIV